MDKRFCGENIYNTYKWLEEAFIENIQEIVEIRNFDLRPPVQISQTIVRNHFSE